MKYRGKKCPACGEVFKYKDDDIVVCPDCGTPHHRKCYRINGECVNTVRHKMGFNWNEANRTVNATDDILNANTDKESGNPVGTNAETIEVTTIPEFIESNLSILEMVENGKDGCTLREILDFVNRNVLYYLPVFAKIRNMGRNISFNLICLLFPQIYFAHRKMWFWALLTSLISVILIIPMMIGMIVSDSANLPQSVAETLNSNAGLINALMDICAGADLLMRILLCFFANRLYYNFAVKSVRRIKRQWGEDFTKEQLVSAGGTSFVNIILITLIIFAMVFCAMLLLEFILPMIV